MKIFNILEKTLLTICFFLLMFTLLITGYQVFSRYLFGEVFAWTEELVRYCSVAVTFLGAAIAVRYGDHISVDLLSDIIKNNRIAKTILFVFQEIATIVFYILIVVSTIEIWPSTAQQTTPGLAIPMVVPYSPLIIGSIAALLFNFEKIYHFFKVGK